MPHDRDQQAHYGPPVLHKTEGTQRNHKQKARVYEHGPRQQNA